MKKLSIIISTVRNSNAFYSSDSKKHIFEDLFESIEIQNEYHKYIELLIVDEVYEYRDLKKEIESIKKWSFDYKIVFPDDTFWRQKKLFHLNSSFNKAFLQSSGEFLFFASDCVHFPLNFFEKYFYYIDRGYCPHAFFFFTYDKKLIVRENHINDDNFKILNCEFKKIPNYTCHGENNTIQCGYTINLSYDDIISKNFLNYTKISDPFIMDGRIDNLIIKDPNIHEILSDGKEIIKVYPSWYFGNMSIAREDFINLNGYDQNFDGFKGLNDCEIGERYFKYKNFTSSKQNNHILASDLYAYENLQKDYNTNIIFMRDSFIDANKLFFYLHYDLKIIQANNYKIPEEKFETLFLKTDDTFNIECQNFYKNNRPNFSLKDYLK